MQTRHKYLHLTDAIFTLLLVDLGSFQAKYEILMDTEVESYSDTFQR